MARTPVPAARNLGAAIEASTSLANLLKGHQRAQRCYAAVAPHLPPGLRSLVRAGPIDGATWTLLAQNASAAAKLRQCLPEVLAAAQLCEPGLTKLEMKILPRQTA